MLISRIKSCALALMVVMGAGAALAHSRSRVQEDAPTKSEAIKDDLQGIQGKWRRVSSESGGQDWMPKGSFDPKSPGLLIQFKDNKWQGMDTDGKSFVTHHKIVLKQKDKPRQMLLEPSDEAGSGSLHFRAIYKLEGETLTLCIQFDSDKPIPTDFSTRPGDGRVLDVYKRE